MKILAFLICGLAFGLVSFGQNRISLSDSATVDLPAGMQKISHEDALSFAGKQFNNDKIILNSISKRRPDNIYKVNNILVSLFTDNNSVKEGHLTDMKKGLDDMLKNNPTYKSTLEKINNNSVLVLNYVMGNVEYYRFFSFNANNTRSIAGILEFDTSDKNEATTTLDHLFKSIWFKD